MAHKKHVTLWTPKQDYRLAPKVIVTDEYLELDKQLEPIEEELYELIKKMPLAIEKKIKGKICTIATGVPIDPLIVDRVRLLRKEAARIGKQLDDLFFKSNPAWAKFYGYEDRL